ncbi:amidohydrolase family protein, partial [Patescibacteria group bacterium]|nr:amidohydrolase family protein [Patescibacteria group bacterium]
PATDLLFENGLITAIGQNLTPPENCEIIDVTGKNIYPGLIEPNSYLGLIEIGSVPVTVDLNEIGKNNADVKTSVAYNPDSEIIPTVRSNGITTALIAPKSSEISGRSCIVNLDGWTIEDALIKDLNALHIYWPSQYINTSPNVDDTPEKQIDRNIEKCHNIYHIFEQAEAYFLAKKAGKISEIDQRLEAIIPAFEGKLPLFIHADTYRQIEQAITFTQKHKLRMVLVGGQDTPKMTEILRQNSIPVILGRTQALPNREDENYDQAYSLAAKLYADSVQFCFSNSSYTGTRNLPFQAAQAVAFGIPKEIALRSVTLSTAEILGIDDILGSLEIGKKATIVVSKGDILDHRTHQVERVFIDGRIVDLDNKQKELFKKYLLR